MVEGQCILGGIYWETHQVFLVPVDEGDLQTIPTLVEKYVVVESHIVTESCKVYDKLGDSVKWYTHSTVNHSKHFVVK